LNVLNAHNFGGPIETGMQYVMIFMLVLAVLASLVARDQTGAERAGGGGIGEEDVDDKRAAQEKRSGKAVTTISHIANKHSPLAPLVTFPVWGRWLDDETVISTLVRVQSK
jgi:hypothetical protein